LRPPSPSTTPLPIENTEMHNNNRSWLLTRRLRHPLPEAPPIVAEKRILFFPMNPVPPFEGSDLSGIVLHGRIPIERTGQKRRDACPLPGAADFPGFFRSIGCRGNDFFLCVLVRSNYGKVGSLPFWEGRLLRCERNRFSLWDPVHKHGLRYSWF